MSTDLAAERDRGVQLIVDSPAAKRLIVASLGTGKTYVFHKALAASNGRGLALTFIKNLADHFCHRSPRCGRLFHVPRILPGQAAQARRNGPYVNVHLFPRISRDHRRGRSSLSRQGD